MASAVVSPTTTSKIGLKIGSLIFSNRVLLSPLEGVSDLGFRRLCHGQGASFTWTEMVRAQGIAKNNAATFALIDTFDASVPTGLQLMTKSGKELAEALSRIESLANSNEQMKHWQNITAIDLNFGCPSRDIVNIGAGPALLKRKNKLLEIFTVLRQWKDSTSMKNIQAVGCKIRLGLNPYEVNNKVYMSVAELANQAQLDYLTVHARHGMQKSSEPATWDKIQEIKSIAQMPVIANGDIWSRSDMGKVMASTGCDGVMVARTAIRNPWIFRELSDDALSSAPSVEEVEQAIVEYTKLSSAFGSKEKYKTFNLFNLQRILEAVKRKETTWKYIGPKNMHFS